jgi:diketogulonate reductase-like aldo/keto reductase
VRGLRFSHPSIAALAEKYGKTPAQVLLRYSLQKVRPPVPVTLSWPSRPARLCRHSRNGAAQGFVAIPKSASRARIRANLELFEFALEPAEMDHLDSLDEGLVTDWDPTHDP